MPPHTPPELSRDSVGSSEQGSPEARPDSPASSKRRIAPKEVRRAQLIEATIESVARHGLRGTTMSTVTEIAGLSIGLVNFHFKSKQNLFEQTLLHMAQEHYDHWQQAYEDAGLGAADKLAAIVASPFHPDICTPERIAIWFAFYGEAGFRTQYRSIVGPIDAKRHDISVTLIEQIIAEGGYDLPCAQQIARTLEALYDGTTLHVMMYPDLMRPDEAHDQIMAYLSAIFPKHFCPPVRG